MNEYMQYLAEQIPEKDSLKLVKDEAKIYYKAHSLDDCFNMGIELYRSDNFQIQEVGVFLLEQEISDTGFRRTKFMGFII